MADEQLRMRALVVDNASGPLQKIAREVRTLASQRVDTLNRQFDTVRSRLAPIEGGINGIGMSLLRLTGPLGAVAAVTAGAMYAAGKSISDFAANTRALDDFSKATGFSISQVEKFNQVMSRLDISREQAQSGMAAFGGNLTKMRLRTAGELNEFLRNGGAGDLADKLTDAAKKGDNEGALRIAVDYIEKLDKLDPQKAALLAQHLFGDASFRKLSEYNDQLKKSGEIIDRNVDAAKKFRDEMSNITEKADRLQTIIGNKGLGAGAGVLGLLNSKEITGDNGGPIDRHKSELQSKQDVLKEVERRLGQTRNGSVEYNRLAEQREKLTREIGELTEGLRKLSDEVDRNVKKMSFQGSFGGGSMVVPASYTGGGNGGGGLRNFRMGGFRGGSVGIGAMGSDSGSGGASGSGQGTPSGSGSLPGLNKSIEEMRGTPGVGADRGKLGKGDDPRGMEAHIREEARKNNIDPDTAVAVAKSEGLRTFGGDVKNGKARSFGAFQLFTGGGLGNEFQKQTGLDPSDPANEKATISWAMKNAGRTGWGPYHGAARTGIGPRDGIGGPMDKPIAGIDPHRMDPMAPAGSGITRDAMATVSAKESGRTFKVKAEFAQNFQRFLDNYEAAGGRAGPESGTLGTRPGNKSYHPLGRALDLNQVGYGIRGRGGKTLPRDVEDKIATDAGLWPGSRFGDAGHFEVRNRDLAIAKQRQWEQEARDRMDRAQGNEMSAKVEGTGRLTVDVTGPKGTRVGAEAGGLFKEVQINRSTQMTPAAEGPREDLTR